MCRGGLSWLTLGLFLGCSTTQPSAPTDLRPAEPSETQAVQVPPSASTKSEPAPETSLAEIGWDSLSRPTELARKENREALALHRAGKYAEAQVGFARAVEISPGHDLARFNLACAYARLGKLDEAAAELNALLERDLLRFQPRWRGEKADPDLDALRDSKHAAILDNRIKTLRVAYDEAHDIGIPAYAYRYRPLHTKKRSKEAGGTDGETLMAGGMDWLVAGTYLPQAKRFVPLTRGGTLSWLDLRNRRVVHISSG